MVENVVSEKGVRKDEFYQDADDKNVAGVIVYLNATDSKLYYNYDADAETSYTNEVPADDYKKLFFNNAVVFNGTGYYKAVGFDETNGITWAIPEASVAH